jgi:uncharacterized protein (TIGR02453 family)
MAKASRYFSDRSLKFLSALAQNNHRDWFAEHKSEYEDQVKAPFLRLIGDLAEPLRNISPNLVADPKPIGGSMFRIYRDTRFAADKRPYKTHSGANFYHAATRAVVRGGDGDQGTMGRLDAPGFYFHLQPGESYCGGGLWHPQPATLLRVRHFMTNNPASWKQATRSASFRKIYGPLKGESNLRPPRGFDPGHELIEDLRRKDYVCSASIDDQTLTSANLPKVMISRFVVAAPLIDWLCGALELEF